MTSTAAPGFGRRPSISQNASGDATAILGPSNIPIINIPQGIPFKKYSSLQKDFTDRTVTWAYTSATSALDKTYQNYSNNMLRVDITATPAQIRKGTVGMTCDPVDQMLTLEVYIPFMPQSGGSGHSMSVTLYNTNGYSANYTTFTFDSGYLRQGKNSLRMYMGDTNGAAGTGTLANGAGKTVTGTGCDMSQTIGYFEINFNNMTGLAVHLCSFRRSAKLAKTYVMMGFDATGGSNGDEVMTTAILPLFDRYGCKGYFTVTRIYDMLYSGSADDLRKRILYGAGWDAINHTWSHGGTKPGGTQTVTTSRTGSTVTVTGVFPADVYPTSTTFHAAIKGATGSYVDMNGVFEMTVVDTTHISYTAAGTAGAGTGTITYSTLLADVIPNVSTLSTQICDQEIVTTAKMMRTLGFNRGSTVGAYPNNSCPELTTVAASCSQARIGIFRGTKGGIQVNEFGIDNPLHFGSSEFGSGTSSTTTQFVIDKILGAINRGEPWCGYGHYALNPYAAGFEAHVNANFAYAPGQGGNPNPPLTNGSYNGYWYVPQFELVFQFLLPYVAAGQVEYKTLSEFQAIMGMMQ
jgi:hypothetical protein